MPCADSIFCLKGALKIQSGKRRKKREDYFPLTSSRLAPDLNLSLYSFGLIPKGRERRGGVVSLEAGDSIAPFSNGGGGNDGNFEMRPMLICCKLKKY